jgi:hypothetical protein
MDAERTKSSEQPCVCVGVAVNSDQVLNQNLLASPDLRGGMIKVIEARNAASATVAIRSVIERADSPVVIMAHQDVYLPAGFIARLRAALERVERLAPNWAVLGIIGVDAAGRIRGRTWSTGLKREVGTREAEPVAVVSLDEVLLVLRKDAIGCVDTDLTGFHLYGTDLVRSAMRAGRPSFVVDLPVVHNSVRVRGLDGTYERGFVYMSKKWRSELPLPTCVLPITSTRIGLWRYRLRLRLREWKRRDQAVRDPDPASIARRLGYEADHSRGDNV